MTLEKVRLNKNSKQVKFRRFLRLSVTFKINSHKSYWAQIHRKHLSSPFCLQNRALTDASLTDRSLLEGMCHVNFWCFSRHVRPLPFFILLWRPKKIFQKKNNKQTNIPPRFLGHHRVSLKYLKYPAIVYSPLIAWIDALNLLFFGGGGVGCLHVLPSLHLKLNMEVLRHWLASFFNISTGSIVSRLRAGSNLSRYGCLHYMVI